MSNGVKTDIKLLMITPNFVTLDSVTRKSIDVAISELLSMTLPYVHQANPTS